MKRHFLSSPEEIIDEAKNGRMFILVDDEDRENEGDLVIPAGARFLRCKPKRVPDTLTATRSGRANSQL